MREEDYGEEFDTQVVPKKFSLGKTLLQIACYLGGILLVSYLLVTYVVQRTVVSGDSMNDYLLNGDNILVEKLSYRFGEIDRFDIIVFEVPYEKPGTYYIKRVIGMPGETVRIEGDTVFINGQPLEEDYGKEAMREAGVAEEDIVLGADEYFVLGDNRNNSTDSRVGRLGNIKKSQIIGKAWLRIFPFRRFGILQHQ